MNAGDVYWVEFPPRGGDAQAGRRPAILVQGPTASARLSTVLLVPLTTQLTTLDKRILGTRLGSVSAPVIEQIWRAFDDITERALLPSTPPDDMDH